MCTKNIISLIQIELDERKIRKFIEIADMVFVREYLGIDLYDELLSDYATAYQISVFYCKDKSYELRQMMIGRMRELKEINDSHLLQHLFS